MPAPAIRQLAANSAITLVTPQNFSASVVLKLVEITPASSTDAKGTHWYAWWAVAGRDGNQSVTVTFDNSAPGMALRFDVPIGVAKSTAYLQPHLRHFYETQGWLPGNTPVIRD